MFSFVNFPSVPFSQQESYHKSNSIKVKRSCGRKFSDVINSKNNLQVFFPQNILQKQNAVSNFCLFRNRPANKLNRLLIKSANNFIFPYGWITRISLSKH